MLRNRLSPKLFVVIFLTLLAASFSYAEEENTSNSLAKNTDESICAFINDLATPEQVFIDEEKRRGLNCSKKVTLPPSIPANSHIDGSSWTCNTNYYKSGSICKGVPANAYSTYSSNFWYCNDGYEKNTNKSGCVKQAPPPLIQPPLEYPISPTPEKAQKSYSSSLLMIAVFLFILFNVAFKIVFRPKFTIKLRPFPKKKSSPPSSEETSKPLSSQNRPEVKAHSSDVESHLSNQTETIKSLRNDLSTLMKTINDMSQTFMTLKTNLDQKDEEIARYKDGYDATIFKNFLLRFTRVDKVIKEYLGDNKIDINGLKDIQIQMNDALAECDVEVFSPKIGANFKSAIGVADNPEIRETSDKSQDSTIAEILMPGYHRKLSSNVNDDYQIIIEAKVVIYVYKK
jgi:molecular chaperone GrpE (heat shock protein)